MSRPMLRTVQLKAWGPRACFTRPETPTDRVSYPVPTPSAMAGLFEAILMKPQFYWQIRQIQVLKPIRYFTVVTNEVSEIFSMTRPRPFNALEKRTQRTTMGLRDVAYLVTATAYPYDGTGSSVNKYTEQFLRRLETGACYHRPYLGIRDYGAWFSPPDGSERPIDLSIDLGRMLFGGIFESDENGSPSKPVWFEAQLAGGILDVPVELYNVTKEREMREKRNVAQSA